MNIASKGRLTAENCAIESLIRMVRSCTFAVLSLTSRNRYPTILLCWSIIQCKTVLTYIFVCVCVCKSKTAKKTVIIFT